MGSSTARTSTSSRARRSSNAVESAGYRVLRARPHGARSRGRDADRRARRTRASHGSGRRSSRTSSSSPRHPGDLGRHSREERRRGPRPLPRRDRARSRSTRRSRSSSSTPARPTGAPEIARDAGAVVHEIPAAEFGHGRTRNLGVELARGDLLVFTSQDAVAADDRWLATLAGAARSAPDVAGAYGRQLPHPDARPPERFFLAFLYGSVPRVQRLGDGRGADVRVDALLERQRRDPAAGPRAIPVPRRPDDERGPGVVAARPPRGPRAGLRARRGGEPLARVHGAVRRSAASSTPASPPSTPTSRATSRVRRSVAPAARYAREELAWLWRTGQPHWIPYTVVYELAKFAGLQLGLRHDRLPRRLVSRLSGLPARETPRPARPDAPPSEPQRGCGSRTTTTSSFATTVVPPSLASRSGAHPGRRRRSPRRGAPPAQLPPARPRGRGSLPREREPVDEADLPLAERGKRRPAHEVRHREVQTRVLTIRSESGSTPRSSFSRNEVRPETAGIARLGLARRAPEAAAPPRSVRRGRTRGRRPRPRRRGLSARERRPDQEREPDAEVVDDALVVERHVHPPELADDDARDRERRKREQGRVAAQPSRREHERHARRARRRGTARRSSARARRGRASPDRGTGSSPGSPARGPGARGAR